MEAIGALGLASNVVQFVDFLWKLLREYYDLRKLGTNASAENNVIEAIARDLASHKDRLLGLSSHLTISESMSDLVRRCKAIADELLGVLNEIRVKGPHKRWKSFIAALQSVWRREQIINLLERLEKLRAQMHYSIELMTSERTSEIQKILMKLAAENERLALDGTRKLEIEMQTVRKALAQLQFEVKGQISDMKDRTSTGLAELSHGLSSLAEQIGTSATNQSLLRSLWYRSFLERHANIAASHGETFKWVLEPSSPTGFAKWLQSESGIYWMMGKAGSGKSTLMKFIINDPRTTEALKAWSGVQRLAIASFFFWNAGNTMQKSQEGLFRSILYELLRQCPDLIQSVCAHKVSILQPFSEEPGPWSKDELLESIGKLKQHSGVGVKFCFFIDGLDEYDGDPDQILKVLESFRCWPQIKLCVSSRPWNEFADAFSQPSDLRLALETLTREDIRIYVRETLEQSPRFRVLEANDSRSQDLVQEISEKASGVFLWVVLVVRSLLTGLTNADRISHLQKRLRGFPESLEKYFSHILNSVEKCYREETAKAFKFALAAVDPLSLMTYSFLDDCIYGDTTTSAIGKLTEENILSRQDDTRRRLNGRCKGLLEVTHDSDHEKAEYSVCYPKVDFLHRTVRDFLLTKDVQSLLSQNLEIGFEPKVYLCKALLVQLKHFDYRTTRYASREPRDLLEELLFYARELEVSSGNPQTALMDEVGQIALKEAKGFVPIESKTGYLRFLISRRLNLYVGEVLTKETPLTISAYNQLLAAAVLPRQLRNFSVAFDPLMVNSLLKYGASPNGSHGKSTIWGHLLCDLQRGFSHLDEEEETHLLQVFESMLLHGADPDLLVEVQKQSGLSRRLTGRAADLYKSKPTKAAKQILYEQLGEEKATRLLSRAQPQARSLLWPLTSRISGTWIQSAINLTSSLLKKDL